MECIVLTFSSRDNNDDLIAIARAAYNFGYESFWTGASWGRDA